MYPFGMNILVLNCGSSSVKFQVIGFDRSGASSPGKLAKGIVERVGGDALLTYRTGGREDKLQVGATDHDRAVRLILERLSEPIDAVGHRVVHGGERFMQATLLTAGIIEALDDLSELAPLHNPASVRGIRAALAALGTGIPMVASFDTAFHANLPQIAATYAIPFELAQKHRIRRFGFHGLAHQSMVTQYCGLTGRSPDEVNIITLQLGNGCSVTAVRNGKSVDTSMGFTPLEGLVMGTRSGDLDPALVAYLAHKEQVSADTVEQWLNEQSGLLGVSGLSSDMRDLADPVIMAANPRARLAVEVFCYRARKYLGAYLAVLGGAQAVVFGGGIGEHSPLVRQKICEGMEWCGLVLDDARNHAAVGEIGRISADHAAMYAYVIPPDEELLIAQETFACLQAEGKVPL